jgi:hypothetical protein
VKGHRRHKLPSGRLVYEHVSSQGEVTFRIDTVSNIDGLDAMELGKLAAATYRTMEIGQSGRSISAECPCGEGKNPLHALLKSHDRPLSNKTGRSGEGLCGWVP